VITLPQDQFSRHTYRLETELYTSKKQKQKRLIEAERETVVLGSNYTKEASVGRKERGKF